MAAIRSFRDLEVYKLGLEEARKIFLLTKSFSTQEKILSYKPNSPVVAGRQCRDC